MKRLFLTVACLFTATTAQAQTAGMQSPAYQECTTLASSNPAQALAKADAWLKMDAGIAAQHCRAMALFGLRRFAEAGDALASVRDQISAENIALRGYVARQSSQAYQNANAADKAMTVLTSQLAELNSFRGDNAVAARQTSDILLDRARLNITYGKLDEAAKDLDHAVSLTPINEEVLLTRAELFEKMGDKSLALSDAQAVTKINSGNSKARELVAKLSGAAQGSGIATPSQVVASPDAPALNQTAPAAAPFAQQQPEAAKPANKKRSSKRTTTPASEAP